MKQKIFSLFVGLLATVAIQAQQIAVVSGGGATSVYQTLADAIEGAASGSTIYLPGGGFQISDDVKITKRLNIIGIGHKAVSENADGNTVISGNLFFNENSDGSAVMGCYISGNVKIGYDEKSVNNILIKYCNLNAVEVHNNTCTGTEVSQNYIRSSCNFHYSSAKFNNNVASGIYSLNGGIISHNLFTYKGWRGSDTHPTLECSSCTISYNIALGERYFSWSDNEIYRNMSLGTWGQRDITLSGVSWTDVFADFNNGAITPASNFHFKGEYQQYESEVGIYGGPEPFQDSALPPVPYIVSKVIPEQTDASGKLNIKIRVKAGE